MTVTNRFNPEPDAQYGKCNTCGIDIPTVSEGNEHLRTTFEASTDSNGRKGHSVRILNPSRGRRIEQEVAQLIEDAISTAMSDFDRLIDNNDVTGEELRLALRNDADFADAWEEYCDE